MRLLVEGYKYDKSLLKDILGDIANDALDGNDKFRYVGYLWSDVLNEAVFFLPKVIVYKPDDDESDKNQPNPSDPDKDKKGRVFGEIDPVFLAGKDLNSIVLPEKKSGDTTRTVTSKQKEFLLEFAIRIYRALVVFKKNNKNVSLEEPSKHSVRGAKHVFDTRLDVILALLEFYRRNRDFVVFTAKRCHSGFNKVNWPKTVAKKTPIFQSDNEPVYVQTINKKKRIDFEEELLVIFHSILHYIAKTWGFPVKFDLNYEPIAGARFKRYLDGYGAARLRAIKYRYFSDKLLELWELCYLFFEKHRKSARSTTPTEYLFGKKFDVVFEAMIDELVGDSLDENLAGMEKLKEQADRKRADHIYLDKSILGELFGDVADNRDVCCIGDSKYYGIGNAVDGVPKQFTYAKNVIQWNIDHNLGQTKNAQFPLLRDDVTEGYNIVPNFFISAFAGVGKKDENGDFMRDKKTQNLIFDKDGLRFDVDGFDMRPWNPKKCFSRQFENRLFDRDTLHIAHLDVNFFYVIALYGRNNAGAKAAWKDEVHGKIRTAIVENLKDRYSIKEMKLLEGESEKEANEFIREHFADLIGKVYSIHGENDKRKYLLALKKPEENDKNNQITKENDAVLKLLNSSGIFQPLLEDAIPDWLQPGGKITVAIS